MILNKRIPSVTQLETLKSEALKTITNQDLIRLAKESSISRGGEFLGILQNNNDFDDVIQSRKMHPTNALYGYTYGKNTTSLYNVRPEFGMDIFTSDAHGILKNSLTGKDACERISESQKKNIPVVYFLGGSTGISAGARTPDFSIPALIERIALEKYNKKLCIINFSRGGTDSFDATNLLLNYALLISVFFSIHFLKSMLCHEA